MVYLRSLRRAQGTHSVPTLPQVIRGSSFRVDLSVIFILGWFKLTTNYTKHPDWHDSSTDTASLSGLSAGIWRVSLDPVEAGGPYNVTATCENSAATLTDVLFGDIWVCGGQSNMAFQTSQVSSLTYIRDLCLSPHIACVRKSFYGNFQIFKSSEELILAAKYPDVRPFKVAHKWTDTELTDILQVKLPWSVPSSGTLFFVRSFIHSFCRWTMLPSNVFLTKGLKMSHLELYFLCTKILVDSHLQRSWPNFLQYVGSLDVTCTIPWSIP